MRQAFQTSDGSVEVVVDEASRTVSMYRFDAQRRTLAATMESWDYVDLADVLVRKMGLSSAEARDIAEQVRTLHAGMRASVPLRNILRVVDGLFFYLVGAIFALTSSRGQRLGDRAAHTLVVRR